MKIKDIPRICGNCNAYDSCSCCEWLMKEVDHDDEDCGDFMVHYDLLKDRCEELERLLDEK